MMKKIVFFILGLYWNPLMAQQMSLKAVKLGHTAPDISFSNIRGFGSESKTLKDFKGKLIVLDFWSIYCIPCIEAFPKIQALQKQFAGSVQFLLVNTLQDSAEIVTFLNRYDRIKKLQLSLAFVSSPDDLVKLFPHDGLPHQVWIDQQGIFTETSTSALNEENIRRKLNGKPLIAINNDSVKSAYDPSKFLWQQSAFADSSGLSYSMITKALPAFNSTSGFELSQPHGSRLFMINFSIKDLYRQAYALENGVPFPTAQVSLELNDNAKYVGRLNGDLQWENLYCYELLVENQAQPTTLLALTKHMQTDLKRRFDLHATIEKRRKNCLVLTCAQNDMLQTKGGTPTIYKDLLKIELVNQPVSKLVDMLSYYLRDEVLIDSTNYPGNIDISIETELGDPREVAEALRKYHLSLRRQTCSIDMLILRSSER